MAHPFNENRQNKVEHNRVGHITKGYERGGDVAQDRKMIAMGVHAHEKNMHKGEKETKFANGGAVKQRADRPTRAHGGRVKKHKGTTVNVIVGGQHAAPPMGGPVPPVPAPGVMRPPAPPPGAGLPPGMPPPGLGGPPGGPPGLPPGIRNMGGRTYKTGGAVKDDPVDHVKSGKPKGTGPGTKVWRGSIEAGGGDSKHFPGKNDQDGLNRGRQITYKHGGKVRAEGGPVKDDDKPDIKPFAPTGNATYDPKTGRVKGLKTGGKVTSGNMPGGFGPKEAMAPKLDGGAGGGEARLEKPDKIIIKGKKKVA